MKKMVVGCWLLVVGVAMAAGMARAADPVSYLDWDDANGKMTNATISASDNASPPSVKCGCLACAVCVLYGCDASVMPIRLLRSDGQSGGSPRRS